MFNKLISRFRAQDDEHPLGSDKRIAETLAEIRASEGEGAVLDVDHWLSDVEQLAQTLGPVALRRAVSRLDEFAQAPLQAAWGAWFDSRNRGYLSERGWQTLVTHYELVAAAYLQCLAAPDLEQPENQGLVPSLAARAMRALVQGKKLLRLRYRVPDAAWWEKVGTLLAWSRERNASQSPVVVYPGEDQGSVWREYLVGVYLEIAPLDSMLQRHIEAVDGILRKFSGALVVRAQAAGNELFCLDPAASQGAFRKEAGRSYPPTVGYIVLDSVRAQLVRLAAQLRAARPQAVPEWLAHTQCSPGQLTELVHVLILHWSSEPPQRQAPRKNAEGELRAVFGFGLVRRMAASSALARSGRRIDYDTYLEQLKRHRFGTAEGLQDGAEATEPAIPVDPFETLEKLEASGQRQMMEMWQVRDVSEGGIGVRMPHLLGRHAIGALVGFRFADQLDWQAGIVRRLRRDAQGRSLAGIEWLPGPPACAQIKAMKQVDDGPWSGLVEISGHGFTDAVVLAPPQQELLLPPGTFSAGAVFRVVVEGQSRFIRLLALVGHGEDYERVSCEAVDVPAA